MEPSDILVVTLLGSITLMTFWCILRYLGTNQILK